MIIRNGIEFLQPFWCVLKINLNSFHKFCALLRIEISSNLPQPLFHNDWLVIEISSGITVPLCLRFNFFSRMLLSFLQSNPNPLFRSVLVKATSVYFSSQKWKFTYYGVKYACKSQTSPKFWIFLFDTLMKLSRT